MKKHALLGLKNVVGYGSGIKHTHGESQSRDCLLVLVEKKVALKELSNDDVIPSKVEGEETDVMAVGVLSTTDVTVQSVEKARPAKGGNSIGHKDITAGTFGLLVKDNKTGNPVILSNNHVLAKANAAVIGDAIYQPGPLDGGTSTDTIASLLRFVKIKFNGEPEPPVNPPAPPSPPNPPVDPPKPPAPPVKPPTGDSTCKIANAVVSVLNFVARTVGSQTVIQAKTTRSMTQAVGNTVDGAIAIPLDSNFVTTGTKDISVVSKTAPAIMGERVFKNGRTTDSTSGSVVTLNATINVNYSNNNVATFTNQVVTQPMSKGGDSGSTMYNSDGELIGLLFAGSAQATIFNNISDVFTQLDISLL